MVITANTDNKTHIDILKEKYAMAAEPKIRILLDQHFDSDVEYVTQLAKEAFRSNIIKSVKNCGSSYLVIHVESFPHFWLALPSFFQDILQVFKVEKLVLQFNQEKSVKELTPQFYNKDKYFSLIQLISIRI